MIGTKAKSVIPFWGRKGNLSSEDSSREQIQFQGDPVPFAQRASKIQVPKFLVRDMLPNALANWVADVSHRMQCPPEFAAVSVLTVLASIVGTQVVVKPKQNDNWMVVPNLWGALVGEPSTKKSPAISAGQSLIPEPTEIAIQHQSPQADELTGDGLNVPKRYFINDATVEKIGEILSQNANGLLVVRDELVGLMANLDKPAREYERAFYLQAFNGGERYYFDRIRRGTIEIPNLCLSLLGGIQPDKLALYLANASAGYQNDGLLQRLQLMVFPEPPNWEWVDRAPNIEIIDKMKEVVQHLSSIDVAALGAEPPSAGAKFHALRFSTAAQLMYIDWSGRLAGLVSRADLSPLLRQHYAKYPRLYPALALIFELFEFAAGKKSTGLITEESARFAEKWCDLLSIHAQKCYSLANGHQQKEPAHLIADLILSGELDTIFSARDIYRRQMSGLHRKEIVEAALLDLVESNWLAINRVKTAKGGRPTVRYHVNPRCLAVKKMN